MKSFLILLFFMIGFQARDCPAQFVTFTRANNSTNNITIPAGEVWQIHSWYGAGSINDVWFRANLGGISGEIVLGGTSSYFYSMDNPGITAVFPIGFVIGGPITFQFNSGGLAGDLSYGYLLTFKKLFFSGNTNPVSSTSVVIPSSAAGDVDIKLEQSADNVTWTECLPGTYNSSTVKRFFRLRAVEK